ncbi:hypothetical protein COO60DRAFT_441952 [Scenedesmus sp. NREL 46B-D3]|nr:hypothetical protein COO60DRAFT_441952 [Scenedesmus sp. NREL 46B-D3]
MLLRPGHHQRQVHHCSGLSKATGGGCNQPHYQPCSRHALLKPLQWHGSSRRWGAVQAQAGSNATPQHQQPEQLAPPAATAKQTKKLKQLAAQQQQLAALREAAAAEAQQQAASQPQPTASGKQVKKRVAAAKQARSEQQVALQHSSDAL